MKTLYFNGQDVLREVKKAKKAKQDKLAFVKDDGIYLMSWSDRTPVYAIGYNPKISGDVWQKCQDAVGGDDFAESFGLEAFDEELFKEFLYIFVKVSPEAMEMGFCSQRNLK